MGVFQIYTPLPSRAPTDGGDFQDGFVRVEDPNSVMSGALNARPTTLEHPVLPLERDVRIPLSHSEPSSHSYRIDHLRLPADSLGYAGSYRGRMTERDAPVEPMAVHSRSRSGSSGSSERTMENLRTPTSLYPEERVIPPLPHRSGSYMSASKTPTDIYGGHRHDGHPELRTHHNPEIYRDRPARNHPKDPVYYIVPGGMNVIFQDERGNEITRQASRVGDFNGTPRRYGRPAPFVVQDPQGKELYRYDGRDGLHPILRVETYPNRRERSHSSPAYHSDPSKRYHDPRDEYRHYADRRGYGSYRDHRDYRSRGDYQRYGEDFRRPGENYTRRREDDYRRHGEEDHGRHGEEGYGRQGDHESQRNHRGNENHEYHGEYRGHEQYGSHGPTDAYFPGPVREPRGTHSHSSHASMSGPSRQLSPPHTDDRRSGISRIHEGSVHSGGHIDVYDEIGEELDALHMD
ncbi:hypothetical protein SCLCIDRAFT_883534 [Scleroderma citrinum Foug A]|uniref:Uncharacterized protein n=1 Tax=Scleroderma citrinum Foug A TaxID=1036808 RepID=A0A0C3AUI8_9AGAM|nr:hypothetical protein SCLCIDRAFT_883534 [Scleroderma citrinum Foug A]